MSGKGPDELRPKTWPTCTHSVHMHLEWNRKVFHTPKNNNYIAKLIKSSYGYTHKSQTDITCVCIHKMTLYIIYYFSVCETDHMLSEGNVEI